MKFLPIDKLQIPVQNIVIVEGRQYEFVFNYNASYDFFTVTLKVDGTAIVTGEKIVIGKPLFTTIPYPFSKTYFVPMDISFQEEEISFDNFGDKVFLWVFVIEDGVIADE